jgi:hypothetical protein
LKIIESDQHDLMKSHIAVVLIVSIARRPILRNSPDALNLCRRKSDISRGRDFYHLCIGEPDMPKADRISARIPASTASSEKSESHPLVSIAIFSGIGLLVSLIAILMSAQGAWY